jgi:hypothetical protein
MIPLIAPKITCRFVMFIILFDVFACTVLADDFFYIRTDMKVVNGIITEKNLLMNPAGDDFRANKLKPYSVAGTPDEKSNFSPDISAEHNALINLLENHGLKSIQNKTVNSAFQVHEETILSYEGIIIVPYKKNISFNKNGELIATIEVMYSPLADPEKWSWLFLKKKVVDFFGYMLSLF